ETAEEARQGCERRFHLSLDDEGSRDTGAQGDRAICRDVGEGKDAEADEHAHRQQRENQADGQCADKYRHPASSVSILRSGVWPKRGQDPSWFCRKSRMLPPFGQSVASAWSGDYCSWTMRSIGANQQAPRRNSLSPKPVCSR